MAVAANNRSGAGKAEESPPDIPTIPARISDVQVVVREVGTVEPEIKVDIKSNLSGRVVVLPLRTGDRVAKGDLIARIEPDVNQAQTCWRSRTASTRRPSTTRTPAGTTRPNTGCSSKG